jgi:oligosaccharide translocation protein RFT1
MEESTLLYFSRSLADIRDVSSKEKRNSLWPAAVYLRMLLQFSTHLLLLLPTFLPPLLPSLLPFILPSQYLTPDSTASSTLITYLSVYIPLLSLNGILEAFFAATAKPEDLAAQSRAMLIGSAAFAATLFGLTRPECATYLAQLGYSDFMTTEKALIFANASQMLVRITFAQRHATRFFSSIQGITKANTSPDLRTTAVIIACGAALRGAKLRYVQAKSDWETTAAFVGGGGLLGISCLATA